MNTSWNLFEHKGFGRDSLLAVPESLDTPDMDLDASFYRAGHLEGIDIESLSLNHWSNRYLPIQLNQDISRENFNMGQAKEEALRAFLSQYPDLDSSTFMRDRRVADLVFDHRIIKSDLHVLLAHGESNILKERVFGNNAYLSRNGEVVSFNGDNVVVGAETFELTSDSGHVLRNSAVTDRSSRFFKAGSIKVHAKSLRPYCSTGTYGGRYQNGPWIIFRDKLDKATLGFVTLD